MRPPPYSIFSPFLYGRHLHTSLPEEVQSGESLYAEPLGNLSVHSRVDLGQEVGRLVLAENLRGLGVLRGEALAVAAVTRVIMK